VGPGSSFRRDVRGCHCRCLCLICQCAESRHGPIAAAQICSVKPIPPLIPRTSRRAEMARWTEEPVDPRRRKARPLSGI
jgi:hypothetical protein